MRGVLLSSLASKAMPIVLWLRGSKKRYSTAQNTRDEVAGLLARPKSFNPPSRLDRKVDLSVRDVAGWRVSEVTPKGSAPARRALYLHGGAYIHEITSGMWSLVATTALATSTRFTVGIYPLAPLGVAEHVVPAATDLAAEIIAAGSRVDAGEQEDRCLRGTLYARTAPHRDHRLQAMVVGRRSGTRTVQVNSTEGPSSTKTTTFALLTDPVSSESLKASGCHFV